MLFHIFYPFFLVVVERRVNIVSITSTWLEAVLQADLVYFFCKWHLIQSSLMDRGQILHGHVAAPLLVDCVGLFTNSLKGSHFSALKAHLKEIVLRLRNFNVMGKNVLKFVQLSKSQSDFHSLEFL